VWLIELAVIVLLGTSARAIGEAAEHSRWVRTVVRLLVAALTSFSVVLAVVATTVGEPSLAIRALGAGVGVGLAWLGGYRRVLARWVPIDPGSILDTMGLAALQGAIGFFGGALLVAETLPPFEVTAEQRAGQAVAEVFLAFIWIGFPTRRGLRQALERLGLRGIDRRVVAVSVVFTLALFAVSVVTSLLASLLQPGVIERIEERLLPLTTAFASPVAALALGVLAGTGEEILFRGAIQPRYGLLLTTLLFTVLHVQYELSVVSLGVFGLAILLGLERRWFGTTACILTHALYDALAILLQGTLR
jgi:uncharacterized protein